MKALVGAFNQEKALVGAFSVITYLRMELFEALIGTLLGISRRGVGAAGGGDGAQGHSAEQGDDQRQPAAQQEHAAHAPSAHGE